MRRIKRPICSITGPRSTSLRPNRQNSRNPARCQETTVSGWTMIKASDQRSHNRRSTIQNHRSSGSSLGRGCFRLTTASCCEEQQLPARVCGGAGRRHAGKRLLHRPRSPSSDLSRRHRQAKCCQCSRLTFYRDDILMTHRSVRSTRAYENQPLAALTEQTIGLMALAIELLAATFWRSAPGTGCSFRTGVTLIFAPRPNVSRQGCPCDPCRAPSFWWPQLT